MRRGNVTSLGSLLAGAGIGAGLMYVFDPNRGRSRRVVLRDRMIGALNAARCEANKQLRNLGHHLLGGILEFRSSLRDRVIEIPDDILLDRVRAQLGRAVRHFGLLDLRVVDGCVIVEGPALKGESRKVERRLDKVRGVRSYHVRLREIGEPEIKRMSGARGASPRRIAL